MTILTGGFADPARDAAHAFRAAMNAMARPGTIHTVAGAEPPAPLSPAAGVLLLTLCDPDTVLHLAGDHDTPDVRGWATFHTGTRFGSRADCTFAIGTWDALLPLTDYPVGTPEYPDRSATLIVDMAALSASGATLTGPGIRDTATLSLPAPDLLRANAALFPLGLDLFLTAGDRLAALPRSTRIA